jgi:hypothetical protein
MKVRVQVVIEAEGEATEVVREVARWSAAGCGRRCSDSASPRRRACWRGFSRRWSADRRRSMSPSIVTALIAAGCAPVRVST